MSARRRRYGLRFSSLDAVVLISTVVVTVFLVAEIGMFGYVPAFVVLHFFLFCNVFRIRRKPELVWAFCFVVVAVVLLGANSFDSVVLMSCQLPVTIALIARELRHPSYHGIFARQLNPCLNEYLAASDSAASTVCGNAESPL